MSANGRVLKSRVASRNKNRCLRMLTSYPDYSQTANEQSTCLQTQPKNTNVKKKAVKVKRVKAKQNNGPSQAVKKDVRFKGVQGGKRKNEVRDSSSGPINPKKVKLFLTEPAAVSAQDVNTPLTAKSNRKVKPAKVAKNKKKSKVATAAAPAPTAGATPTEESGQKLKPAKRPGRIGELPKKVRQSKPKASADPAPPAASVPKMKPKKLPKKKQPKVVAASDRAPTAGATPTAKSGKVMTTAERPGRIGKLPKKVRQPKPKAAADPAPELKTAKVPKKKQPKVVAAADPAPTAGATPTAKSGRVMKTAKRPGRIGKLPKKVQQSKPKAAADPAPTAGAIPTPKLKPAKRPRQKVPKSLPLSRLSASLYIDNLDD